MMHCEMWNPCMFSWAVLLYAGVPAVPDHPGQDYDLCYENFFGKFCADLFPTSRPSPSAQEITACSKLNSYINYSVLTICG